MEQEAVMEDAEESTGFTPSQEEDSINVSSVDESEGLQEETSVRHYAAIGQIDSGLEDSLRDEQVQKAADVSNNSDHLDSALAQTRKEESGIDIQESPQSDENRAEEDDGDDETMEDGGQEDTVDPYHYTKRPEFTSEIFKIEINHLPKTFGFKEFRKRLTNLKLNPHKIKFLPYNKAFVTFKSEEECEKALATIPGHIWKGQQLGAKRAKPSADPQMKRKAETEGDNVSKTAKLESTDDGIPPEIRLKNSVTRYWNVPYGEQLKKKTEMVTDILKSLSTMREVKDVLASQRKKFDGLPCEVLPIKARPENTEGYRNKCEFTISKSVEGKDNTVGFRFGLYKEGCQVGSALDVAFLPDAMKKVLKAFQQYLDCSQYCSYDPVTHAGHWHQLTVRSTTLGQVMAIPLMHLQDLTKEDVAAEKDRLTKYFSEGPGSDSGVTSLYFQGVRPRDASSSRTEMGPDGTNCEFLWGDRCIHESLLDLKFRISPSAFFQVNTPMAEVLYSQVAEWLQLTQDTVVLDICCGTGTIGLSMAKRVKKVIGIEMCKEAIEDAKVNAEMNGITNAEFHCDRAENVVVDVMKSLHATHVVAVVDPPRAGLHKVVIKALRNCRRLRNLIYVSCNANSAKGNFVDLMRPPSNKLKGEPYLPVKAVPVDLFPHTPHCELVMLLERDPPAASSQD